MEMAKKHNPIKDVIKGIITQLEKKEKKESEILTIWGKAVGKRAAENAKPAFLKENELIVHVKNSAWLYELTLKKKKLVQTLNNELGPKKQIKEIRFKIGK